MGCTNLPAHEGLAVTPLPYEPAGQPRLILLCAIRFITCTLPDASAHPSSALPHPQPATSVNLRHVHMYMMPRTLGHSSVRTLDPHSHHCFLLAREAAAAAAATACRICSSLSGQREPPPACLLLTACLFLGACPYALTPFAPVPTARRIVPHPPTPSPLLLSHDPVVHI